MDAQLPQLANNARRAPKRIRARDLPDELTDLVVNRRSAGLASSTHARPVITKAFALPSDHGRGLNDDQSLPPGGPMARTTKTRGSGLPDEEAAVARIAGRP